MKKLIVIIIAICVVGCNGASNKSPHHDTTNNPEGIEREEDSKPDTAKAGLPQNSDNTSNSDDDQNGYWKNKAEEALDEMRELKKVAIIMKADYHLDTAPPDESTAHENWRLDCLGCVSQIIYFYKMAEILYEGEAYKDVVDEADLSYTAMMKLNEYIKMPPM
jgi:hypothetical protein